VRYRANRECPVFPELAGLFRKTTGLVGVLVEALRTLQPAPELALVFGSLARGDENARSDVDLLLIADCTFGATVKALYPAQEILQREINPVLYTATEFARRVEAGEAFARNILANPKLFIIGSENDLGKLAGDSSPADI
jgi:predicted nucleotidyltransferase